MIRIIVWNSNSVTIAGWISVFSRLPNMKIVGSFVDEASLIALGDLPYDLILLERMPEEDWWWLERWLLSDQF